MDNPCPCQGFGKTSSTHNILPGEQLYGEEGTLHALILPVNKMSYSKGSGSASSRMQNTTIRITRGRNKAMPSQPSTPLSVSNVSTASFAVAPGGNVWRSQGRQSRSCRRVRGKQKKPDFRRIPSGRSAEFIKLLLAGAELRVSTSRAAAGGRGGREPGRVVPPLSCQGNETRLNPGPCCQRNAAPRAVDQLLKTTALATATRPCGGRPGMKSCARGRDRGGLAGAKESLLSPASHSRRARFPSANRQASAAFGRQDAESLSSLVVGSVVLLPLQQMLLLLLLLQMA